MEITWAQLTDAGPSRDENEDCIVQWYPLDRDERLQRGALSILCDGVGGHHHGEVASRLAADAALLTFQNATEGMPSRQLIQDMFDAANSAVQHQHLPESGEHAMATTMTLSLFRHNAIAIGHVGDCRIYLIRAQSIQLLTEDHSYVGMQLKMGLITAEEASVSLHRNVITRSVGQGPTISPDRCSIELLNDDILVQCSDGLHGSVSDRCIAETVLVSLHPRDACQRLIATAIEKGSTDNVSVQVIRIDSIDQVMHYRGAKYYV